MPPEEIDIQKLKEDYPPGLIDFILSEKASSQIADICIKNGVEEEEKIEAIAYRITLALLGKLPKDKLAVALEGGVGLSSEMAEKISSETNQLIFSQMFSTESKKPVPSPPSPKKETPEEKPKRPPGKDTYRESIE